MQNIDVRVAATPADLAAVGAVRRAAFSAAYGYDCDDALLFDDQDSTATQVLVSDDETPIGSLRIVWAEDHARVERLAMLDGHNGICVGRRLMLFVRDQLVAAGISRLELLVIIEDEKLWLRALKNAKRTGDITIWGGRRVVPIEGEV